MAKQNRMIKCSLCRREGIKLYLKGTRCESTKCGFHKRDYPPGEHPFRRGKISSYGIRLREKQRCKRTYGVRERQFQKHFRLAERLKGNTGENLFRVLERRLDNVLYRLGMVLSRRHARQMIAHGLVRVNDKKMDRPSHLVQPNDVITPVAKESVVNLFKGSREQNKGHAVPTWLEVRDEPTAGKVVALPNAEELAEGFEPQLIVEICGR